MALKTKSRVAQNTLVAEFTFDIAADTMVATDGVTKTFGTLTTGIVADIISMPPAAVVTSGEIVTDVAVTGSTAFNVSIGDSLSAARYLGATDKTAAGRTALVPTGYLSLGEQIRITTAPTIANATAGKLTVRVHYIVTGRANEVQAT